MHKIPCPELHSDPIWLGCPISNLLGFKVFGCWPAGRNEGKERVHRMIQLNWIFCLIHFLYQSCPLIVAKGCREWTLWSNTMSLGPCYKIKSNGKGWAKPLNVFYKLVSFFILINIQNRSPTWSQTQAQSTTARAQFPSQVQPTYNSQKYNSSATIL